MGIQLGHPTLLPEAASTERKTPKPVLVLKEPSPRKAKFRMVPPTCRGPAFSVAPSDINETTSWSAAARELIMTPCPLMVRKEENLNSSWSPEKRKPSTAPPVNVRVARTASVPTSGPSLIETDIGLSLKMVASSAAINISPLNTNSSP